MFCVFVGTNYTGFRGTVPDRPSGTCHTFRGEYRSYINRSGIEGYLYDGVSCVGARRGVTHGSQNPDLGFAVASFRYACLSCLTEHD